MNTLPGTPEEAEEIAFTAWMKRVDWCIGKLVGFTSDDLPDYAYRDAFRAKKEPLTVARAVIKAAKDY